MRVLVGGPYVGGPHVDLVDGWRALVASNVDDSLEVPIRRLTQAVHGDVCVVGR